MVCSSIETEGKNRNRDANVPMKLMKGDSLNLHEIIYLIQGQTVAKVTLDKFLPRQFC